MYQVRQEGSAAVIPLAGAGEVVSGLREGNWLPSDDVRGPGDRGFVPIEAHPAFAEIAADLERPPKAEEDDTHLDMNPLIDVCLVLLIFFILTITYESLRRSIEVPVEQPDNKGLTTVKLDDIKDRIFRVAAKMEGDTAVVKIEDKVTPLDRVEADIRDLVARTGRREMLFDKGPGVPWGVTAVILDAAKGGKVTNVLYNQKKQK